MQTDASEERLSKYDLLRPLGSGGMGEVYLARDTVLRREVAIKFVSADRLSDPSANARLLREARAAATLDHPGICPVYDVQVDGSGRTCIVMQYVEGETLAARLARGPLDWATAFALSAQIADALAAAHGRGIVHRDLKPQNVIITPEGRPKLLDFGIAHTDVPATALAELATHTASGTWGAGELVGTPAYMSPEQVLRKPVDGRSDLFSLGAVLFECLTGQPAFQAQTDIDTWARVVYVSPPPPSTLRPQVPAHVDDVIAKLLAKDPADRFDSAGDAAAALRAALQPPGAHGGRRRRRAFATIALILVVLTAAVVASFPWSRLRGTSAITTREPAAPVLAVLPLANLSGDPALQYVGAGMAETMSTKLATLPGVAVVSRAEVHDALQRNADVSHLVRAMGVTYAVTGAVQQSGGRLHVTINLLGPDGKTIVSEGGRLYDDSLDRLFELQRRIAEDLSEQIVGRLSAAQRVQLARTPTSNVQAMSAYWRGRGLMEQLGPEPIEPAIQAFSEAVALDSRFALGYAGLGSAYWRKYVETREPSWTSKAVEATERARALDAQQPDVRLALATVYNGVGRTQDAIAEATGALQLQPASYEAHRLLAEIHAARGETDQAIGESLAAVRLRPDYAAGYRTLGLRQFGAGRYDEAAASFDHMARLDPEPPFAYQLRGNAHLAAGLMDAAEHDYSQAIAHGGSFATHSSLGYVYYLRGRFEDAAREYRNAIELRPKNATTHWNLGDAYRQLGRGADARAAYRAAIALFDADLRVNASDAAAIATRATCLARLGDVNAARREVDRAAALRRDDQEVQYQRALVAVIGHRTAEAVAALEAAVAAGYSVPLLKLDRDLAPLNADPRFQSVIRASHR